MAVLRLDGVGKTYPGGAPVVHDASVAVADGEFVVLVGPSGCGKSTILRMVAGLERITKGEVWIGDRKVNNLEPAERNIAMVFQNYALYPHMTVARNMGYGLKNRGMPKNQIDAKVREAAAMLNLTEFLGRKPGHLSGGQRQRVAMGRAIVREPDLFLFDEPLSNLDAKLRNQMRIEIRALQRRLGTTAMYVTHDQVEAMTMADRIIVMNGGRIEQIGTPNEIYEHPASTFVASFMGAPPMNLLNAQVANGRVTLAGGQVVPEAGANGHAGAITVGIRPEDVIPSAEGDLAFNVDIIEELGAQRLLHGHMAGQAFSVTVAKDHVARTGPIQLSLKPAAVHLFDAGTGRRV